MLSTAACPTSKPEVFIAGTEPVGFCILHGGGRTNITTVSGWDTAPAPAGSTAAPPTGTAPVITGSQGDGQLSPAEIARRAGRPGEAQPDGATAQAQQQEPKKEKKSILRRIFGVFK